MLYRELNYANTHFDEAKEKNDLLIERKYSFTYGGYVCDTYQFLLYFTPKAMMMHQTMYVCFSGAN